MTKQHAVLTVDGDPDGDGSIETGKFVMAGDLEVIPGLRTGFLAGGRQSPVNSIIANLVDPGESTNKQFFLDAGAGAHTVEINFTGWEGAEADLDGDGTREPVQWGNTGDASTTTATDATGAKPVTQICVLMQYLLTGTVDSESPATLEWGEWSASGLFDPLDVVLEGPQMTTAASDGSWFSGSLTCIVAADLNAAWDAQSQFER